MSQSGGQFRPAKGGQFAPAIPGQYIPAQGGQFYRRLQVIIKTENIIHSDALQGNDQSLILKIQAVLTGYFKLINSFWQKQVPVAGDQYFSGYITQFIEYEFHIL